MQILGLTGQKRAGKDTVAEILYDWRKIRYVEFIRFAEPIEDMLRVIVPDISSRLTDELKEQNIPNITASPRRLLQTLGTEWGRSIDPDLWVKAANNSLNKLLRREYPPLVVFTDVRFDNEAEYIRSLGGKIMQIRRDLAVFHDSHPSESGINSSLIDITIYNNSTITVLGITARSAYQILFPGD